MSHKVWGVRYPYKVFDIIGHALEHGTVSFVNTEGILASVNNKSKTEGYLNLCLQTGLLWRPEADNRVRYTNLIPSEWGRQLYALAQGDLDTAVRQLFGSIPTYRFHAELLLAELIMTTALRGMTQDRSVIIGLSQSVPWFLSDRLPWIQQAVGWKDSSSYNANDLGSLRKKIHQINTLHEFIEPSAYGFWDNAMGFAQKTDLTRIESLCRFLDATRQQRLRIQAEWLNADVLSVLTLLMVAKDQRYALCTNLCHNAVEKLLKLGVGIRQDQSAAYLFSAVELIIRDVDRLSQHSLGSFGLPGVDGVLPRIRAMAKASGRLGAVNIALGDLFQDLRTEMLGHGLFTSTPLADDDNAPTPSAIQVWRPPHLPADTGGYNFLEELVMLANVKGQPPPPTIEVFLNNSVLDGTKSLDAHIATNPHFLLLLLLLCDVDGASERLRLVEETWHYDSMDLISALDHILRYFSYQVWDEGYRHDPVRRQWLGRELVNLACRLGVCQVDGPRLVERKDGPHVDVYYYKAVNVIRKIRGLELQHG